MTAARTTTLKLAVAVICAITLAAYPAATLLAATASGTTSGKGASAGAKAGGGSGGGKGGAAKSGASGQGNGGAASGGPKGASSGAKASRAQRTAMMSKKAAMKQKKQARMAKLQKLGSNPAANERVSKMVAQIRQSQDAQIMAAEQRLSSGQGHLHKNVAQIVAAVVPAGADLSRYEVTKPVLGEVLTRPPVITSDGDGTIRRVHYEVIKAKVFDVKERFIAPDGTTVLTTVMQVKIPLRARVQVRDPNQASN